MVAIFTFGKHKTITMTQLSEGEIRHLQDLINSLQYEVSKAKDNGGFVCLDYLKEKTSSINRLIKTPKK